MDYTFTSQVHNNYLSDQSSAESTIAGLQSIQPVAAQILSVADSYSWPLHIELDYAATVTYITLAKAKKRHFRIKPNN